MSDCLPEPPTPTRRALPPGFRMMREIWAGRKMRIGLVLSNCVRVWLCYEIVVCYACVMKLCYDLIVLWNCGVLCLCYDYGMLCLLWNCGMKLRYVMLVLWNCGMLWLWYVMIVMKLWYVMLVLCYRLCYNKWFFFALYFYYLGVERKYVLGLCYDTVLCSDCVVLLILL